MASPLRLRILRDIAELQSNPYPNIALHVEDNNLEEACLILTADGYGDMHLTVHFVQDYPLSPPRIEMNSRIQHPNIFGNYICASILNTKEGYTPAYTLKGIAIQLLSFFSSDTIEQQGGTQSYKLDVYREMQTRVLDRGHVCKKCQFGVNTIQNNIKQVCLADLVRPVDLKALQILDGLPGSYSAAGPASSQRNFGKSTTVGNLPGIENTRLPDELLLNICEHLDTEDLLTFAKSWSRIGELITTYDLIRTRELQCFCFKEDYKTASLGVGVSVSQRGRLGFFESEFDLLSLESFSSYAVRRSVQGVPFGYWLPLPISPGHWRKVEGEVPQRLDALMNAANLGFVPAVEVIFHFMNDVVVKLNKAASETIGRSPRYPYDNIADSSLTHASEKAIESYFHLFHLLLCMATSQRSIVTDATNIIRSFMRGKNSKDDCPSLGNLLVAALIAEIDITDTILKSIIRETITRNVVWMLDVKAAGMAELSYLEPSPVSDYRLKQTFQASKTSYRLLMFLNLFRRTAVGSPRKPLLQLRDEAFFRHGAPPRGSAKGLAASIKAIHKVQNFPDFLTMMGLEKPGAVWFTTFLKQCIKDSLDKGYHIMPFTQAEAHQLRLLKEPDVEFGEEAAGWSSAPTRIWMKSFFPARGSGSKGRRGDRGDRGNRNSRGR